MAVHIPQWDLRCEKCSDGQKQMYGCEFDTVIEETWKVREYIWRRCPLKLITQETNKALVAYNFLQKGLMPYMGGFQLNSQRYIESMQVIDAEVKRIEAENLRKSKK